MAAYLIRYTDLGWLRAGLAPTGARRTCPSLTRRAATSGSVSPMPKEGHRAASGHAPQAGVRAWQVRRPWMIRRCENTVHSRFSTMAHSSTSTATGSSLLVRPSRLVTRSTCVSTGSPGTPKALPSTTFAVLRPTPGRVPRSAIRVGTSPWYRATSAWPNPIRDWVLARKNPVDRITSSSSVSYTHLRAHETDSYLVCRLL